MNEKFNKLDRNQLGRFYVRGDWDKLARARLQKMIKSSPNKWNEINQEKLINDFIDCIGTHQNAADYLGIHRVTITKKIKSNQNALKGVEALAMLQLLSRNDPEYAFARKTMTALSRLIAM